MRQRGRKGRKRKGVEGKQKEDHIRIHVSMHLLIPHLAPDLCTNHLTLFLRIPQLPCEQRHHKSFQPFIDLQIIPRSHRFQLFVLRPCTHGDDKLLRNHIMIPGCFQTPFKFRPGAWINPHFITSLQEDLVEFQTRHVVRQTPVGARPCEIQIQEFAISPWGSEFITLGSELWPIFDGITHVAAVDEVELCVVGPGLFDVIDFEVDVGGNPFWLNGGEVVAEDLWQGEIGGEVSLRVELGGEG